MLYPIPWKLDTEMFSPQKISFPASCLCDNCHLNHYYGFTRGAIWARSRRLYSLTYRARLYKKLIASMGWAQKGTCNIYWPVGLHSTSQQRNPVLSIWDPQHFESQTCPHYVMATILADPLWTETRTFWAKKAGVATAWTKEPDSQTQSCSRPYLWIGHRKASTAHSD